MAGKLLYAVDDEASIRQLYEAALALGGYDSKTFEGGSALYAALSQRKPDLILLDLMLQGEDGFALLSELKKNAAYADIPIIVVSARGTEADKVLGLDLGAADYLAKPFGVKELLARINANLRKSEALSPAVLSYKELTMDEARHAATLAKKPLILSKKEYELLRAFLMAPDKVLTKDSLLASVWGINEALETRTLDIHVLHLRKKLAGSSLSIATIRGVGYLLQ